MGKPYSMGLRTRLVAAAESGTSRNEAARRFDVAISTAVKRMRRKAETGSVAPGRMGGHKPRSIRGEHEAWLLERIKRGDYTLRGLVAEFGERGLKVDYRSVWPLSMSRIRASKKTVLASEQDRPDVARRRAQWHRYQSRVDARCLVFLDETWTKTNMAPLRGWSPRGRRLKAKVPHGHWKTMTFLAALRQDRIEAPWLIEGPINGERFRLYVERVLLPTLKPGDIVIMDNLGSHKGKLVRRAIRSVGTKLIFLPKYSPDLNPIEQASAKLKHLLRKAAARSTDTVCDAIGQLLDTFTPEECANYFQNSGYART